MFKTIKFILFLFFYLFLLKCFSQDNSSPDINVIKEIKIIGNKTTKDFIITREIPFNIGDTVSNKYINLLLDRTKSNLLNTSLFNFVVIDIANINNTDKSIYITVEERWYWWPIPIFEVEETNFNTWLKTKNLDRANYGLFLAKENFRGRKERLVFKFQGGYTELAEIRYHIPYINKKQTQGLTVGFNYRQNHELIYLTTNNKRDFFNLENNYVKKEISSRIKYEFRPRLYNTHSLELKYNNVDINDSITSLNNDFLLPGNSSSQFFTLAYSAKRDKRNLKSYATKGHYIDFNIVKNGFNIADNSISSLYISANYRKYWQLNQKLYFSSSIKGKFSLQNPPYFLIDGFGYKNNLVRGYELYVINGNHYGLFKSQLRYSLFKDTFQMNKLSIEKFNKIPISIYPGIFFDAGYVFDKTFEATNSLNNELLIGGGLSLDFVSYYDLVFRMEYSFNKLGEQGFYLHFIAPI